MLIIVTWPTANVPVSNETAAVWQSMGYKVAVVADLPKDAMRGVKADLKWPMLGTYQGYFRTMNELCKGLVKLYRADIVIAGSDMLLPVRDVRAAGLGAIFAEWFPSQGFGVMHPCADPWQPGTGGGYSQEMGYERRMHATPLSIERCEGAWLGRRFILEANGATGPFHGGYDHYFGDVELHDVAHRLGVLRSVPQVRQERIHWSRPGHPAIRDYQGKVFDRSYEKDFALWRARKAKEYPGSSNLHLPTTGLVMP